MRSFWHDLKFAFRIFRKSPTFTIIAVLTLSLGIGANTAIFSYVDAWLIKPLPYPSADRLMSLLGHSTKQGWTSNGVSSTADFYDFQDRQTSFEQTAAWAQWDFNLTGDGPPDLVEGGRVSWNYFETLGVRPLMGRTFVPGDDMPAAPHVVILGRGLWQSRYGSDPNILGRTITVSGEPYSVVGVMPPNFLFPLMGTANLWTPLALTDKERHDHDTAFMGAIGRLKRGVTQQQAGAESATIFAALAKEYPNSNTNITMLVSPLTEEIGKNQGNQQVAILMWVVSLILLIACANVANLMLAHASRRTREFAIRGALGATRSRVIRQLVTESILLFFFGGLGGVLFGSWGMTWIQTAIPEHVRGYLVNYGAVSLDFVTLAFTLGIAFACGLIFGLAPAFQNSKLDLNTMLKDTAGQSSATKKTGRLRRIFVASEVALAVVVLIATTLVVKSFILAARSSPGFNAQNLMTAQLNLPAAKYTSEARYRIFADDVLSRIQALPGVSAAGATSSIPFGGFGAALTVRAADNPAPKPGDELGARYSAVSPGYFAAMQIQVLKGRGITSADAPGGAPVALINQVLADKFWPGQNPLGKQLEFGDQHTLATVVGLVNDVKMYQLRARPERQMYVSLAQFPSRNLAFVARAAGNSQSLPAAIRDSIWAVDSDQPLSSVEPLTNLMAVQDTPNRIITQLMGFFGLLATLLGAVGIFGVMANTVTQRTREIGIRVAMGAQPEQVMQLVIGQGLRLTMIGSAVGILAALGATRMLAFMLYQVSSMDIFTFVTVPVFFTGIALFACYWPARRAMRVDPMVALRHD
jgi:putative ABC transport system permease protein